MRFSRTAGRLLITGVVFATAAITVTLGLVSYRQWREANTAKVTLLITGTSDVSTLGIVVKSPLAIKTVLQRPAIRSLKIIQNQQVPEKWLHQVLWVHANQDTRELNLQIKTTGRADMNESRLILSAIVDVLRELTARSSGEAVLVQKIQ